MPNPGTHTRSLGIAELLELGAGFFQTFGIGHFYAGNWRTGIMLMTSYWFALMANLILVPFLIGVFTLPLTRLIFDAVSTQQLFSAMLTVARIASTDQAFVLGLSGLSEGFDAGVQQANSTGALA